MHLRITRLLLGFFVLPLLCACSAGSRVQTTPSVCAGVVLFEDSMAQGWEKNWFLDGQNAVLQHRDGGLDFITTQSEVDKRIDRGPFDAQHAVLWTRQTFTGDIRISYTYTMLPGCTWQKLIYIQAQGIGSGPYAKDIYAWRHLREIARMDKYYNYMDLVGLSLRDQIRCRRYPWSDVDRNVQLQSEYLPRAENKGFEVGHELNVLIEKRQASLLLRITDTQAGVPIVEHTWDLMDEAVLDNRTLRQIDTGRIGLRLMGGHKINFRHFKVERL